MKENKHSLDAVEGSVFDGFDVWDFPAFVCVAKILNDGPLGALFFNSPEGGSQ